MNFAKNIKKYQFLILFIFLLSITFVNPVYGFHNETEFTIDEDSWWLTTSLIVFFILLITYTKIDLLKKIKVNNILKFNLPKKIGVLIVIITLGLYISLTYHEIFEDEYVIVGSDYEHTMVTINEKEISEAAGLNGASYQVLDIRMLLLKLSMILFDTIRFVPFIVSILLLILVYFFTLKITKNVLASLLTFFLLIQNPLFLKYDTIGTYNNFWIFFYILSLFLISNKTWYASPIFFILSVYAKTLSVIFFPVNILFALQSRKKIRNKIFLIYGSIIVIGIAFLVKQGAGVREFDFEEFVSGFFAFVKINQDPVFLILLIPVIVILYILAKNGIPHASTIMLGILLSLISQPLLVSVFPQFMIHDYRFMSFSIFFAISIGLILSKNQKIIPSRIEKMINEIIFIALVIVSSLTLLPVYLPKFAHQVIKIHM